MDDEGKRKLQLGREQSARALPVLVLLMLVLKMSPSCCLGLPLLTADCI